METQAHVSGRQQMQMQPVERFIHSTARTDWEAMVAELFDRVIQKCPYGIGVISKKRIAKWHRLVIRTNDMFEPSEVPLFMRRYLRVAHFNAIFKSTQGMERHERYDLYKIVSGNLGLPLKSLVYGIQNGRQPDLAALLVFGGERIEGHMERSLELVQRILAAPPTNKYEDQYEGKAKPGVDDYGGYGELITELRDLNLKEIDRMDIREISDLVNGLDAVIEYSPASLRAKYRTLNDHLLQRRRVAQRDRWQPPA